jgi:hypothetical protein
MLPVLIVTEHENPFAYFIGGTLVLGLIIYFIRVMRDGAGLFRSGNVKAGNVSYDNDVMQSVAFQLSNFSYFRQLSPQGKSEFIRRVMNFIETNSIEGEDNFEPSLPDKIHVAAAATQLTFGYDDLMFPDFETVLVYPGIFRLKEEGPLMKGATTPNGVIRISIRDFDSGYANPADKLNVGLHEFGHALFMELLKMANEEDGEVLKNSVHPYLETSDKILNSGKHDNFLRDYAFTNRHEFFAVSVEHFFEAPVEFREKLPELYDVLKRLLKQDPASGAMDHGIIRTAQLITEN